MFCTSCGAKAPDNYSFCDKCGTRLYNAGFQGGQGSGNRATWVQNQSNDVSFYAISIPFAIISAVVLVILVLTKWFTIPLFERILQTIAMFTGTRSVPASFSLLDIFSVVINVVYYIETINYYFGDGVAWVIIGICIVFIIAICTCVVRVLAFFISLISGTNGAKICSGFDELTDFFSSLCGVVFVLMLLLNWFLGDWLISGYQYISLTVTFYITAVIAVLSRIFISKGLKNYYIAKGDYTPPVKITYDSTGYNNNQGPG